jgi:hypothetical protein
MRLALAAAALLFAGLCQVSDARADEDWASHLKVSAVSKDGKVTIVAEGADGWFVNTQFPFKLLGLKGTDKPELTKADAKLEGEKDGKAKRAVFETKATGKVEGTYKIVVCSPNACSPPLKGSFASK